MRFLLRLTNASLAYPRAALGLFLAITALWCLGLPRLRLETDGRTLLAGDHPAVVFQEEVDAAFSPADFLIVGIDAPGDRGVFTPEGLDSLLRLTRDVQALPGVDAGWVRSLATEPVPSWSGLGLSLEPPLAGAVSSATEAAEVRAAALREKPFRGFLISDDGRQAAVFVAPAEGVDRRELFHRVRDLAEAEERRMEGRLRLRVLGPSAAESLLSEHVLSDLAVLLPASLSVVALLLWLWFRRASIVAVGLGEGMAAVLWSLGLMGLAGLPITLVTVVMPVILSTYCVSDTIHVAQRFREKLTELPPREAMQATLEEILGPVLFTSLTTSAGFFSFATSPIPPLRDFGLVTGCGTLFALVISLFVVPPALVLSGFGRGRRERTAAPWGTRLLESCAALAFHRPLTVITWVLLASVLLGSGLLRMEIRDSWIDNFEPREPLVQADGWFNERFSGSNVLSVVLTPAGGAYDPEFLADVERLDRHLTNLDEVGGTLSLAGQLRTVGRALEGEERLPASAAETAHWLLLLRMAGGGDSLYPYMNSEGSEAHVWAFLRRADSHRTERALRAVEAFSWSVRPEPQVRFAGDAYLGHVLVGSISRSLGWSLLTALGLTLLMLLWLFRSTTASLLGVLPVCLAVFWNFGVMGWSEVPLGVATSTFSSISIGIGVDFGIHWLARLRLRMREGMTFDAAIRDAGVGTGAAILLHGTVLLCGFGVLLLSSVPPNRNLGLLMGINLFACLGASLLLLPAVATLLSKPLQSWGRGALPMMSWRMTALLLAAALLLPGRAAAAPAADPTGDEIMAKVNARPRGGDSRTLLHLRLKDQRRGETEKEVIAMRKELPSGYRTLYRISAPIHERGIDLLLHEDGDGPPAMWMYFGSSDHLVRVATRGLSALATDFSCEDLRAEYPPEEYAFKKLEPVTVDGKSGYQIEMVPRTDRLKRELGYDRAIGWVRSDVWMIVKAEYFDTAGKLIKTFRAEDVQQIQGIWTALRTSMINHRASHETHVKVVRAFYKLQWPLEWFDPEKLREEGKPQ